MNTLVGAKRILIYGDSITFARIPNHFKRYDEQTRWPCVMQAQLGNKYEVIEEGLRARMLKGENVFIGDRDGYKQFGPILASHLPLDLVIILLGTNDACSKNNKTPAGIADDLRGYFKLINSWCDQQRMPVPQVLIVSPPVVDERSLQGDVYLGAETVTRALSPLYEAVAKSEGAWFFAADVVKSSAEDGVHLDALANKTLGSKLATFVAQLGDSVGEPQVNMASLTEITSPSRILNMI